MLFRSGLTSIGKYAFELCSGLTSITLPNGLTSIGAHAFYGCSGLTSITLPNGLTSIEGCAFYGCSGLTSLTLPDGITSIESWTFSSCTGLTSITLPDGLTSIEVSAFSDCTGLTSITLPDGLTSIGDNAFNSCIGLTSITLPDGLTSIDNYAFEVCSGLTSITLPDGLTRIGNYAFNRCTGLMSITLPVELTDIRSSAFRNCDALKDVTMLTAVPPTLGTNVFDGSTSLDNIYVPLGSVSTYQSAWSDYSTLIKEAYIVTLEDRGSRFSIPIAVPVSSPSIATAPTVPGYTIAYWYDVPIAGSPIGFPFTVTRDTILYAQSSPTGYTITLDAQGGSVSQPSLSVTYKTAIGTLPTPTPATASDAFLGWFTTPTGGWQYTDATIYLETKDTTLYAHWGAEHKITFNENGGDAVSPSTLTVHEGIAVGTMPSTARTGYNFLGWFDEDNSPKPLQYIKTSIFRQTTDIELTARRSAKRYSITFDAQGGILAGYAKQYIYYDDAVTLPTPTHTDYTFKGWFDAASGGNEYTDANYITDGNTTLFAQWTADVTLETHDGNTATPTPHNVEIPFAEPSTPVYAGHAFDGWYTEQAPAGVKITFPFTVTQDTTLHAHWVVAYTVTFDSRGGSAVPGITNVPTGSTIAAPADPTYAGYTFNGWYSNAAVTNAWNFAAHTVTSDTTLYARWTQNPPPVISVSGVSLSPTVISLTEGATATLYASVMPSNATTTSVTWTSSNAAVATVTNQGLVTAIAPGTATITVTTNDGGYKATAVVTVTAAASGVGNASVDNAKLTAYPNPTDGIVTIAGLTPGSVLRLYNVTGTQVALYTATDATMVINIGNLPHGLYYVRTDGHTLRLIKK